MGLPTKLSTRVIAEQIKLEKNTKVGKLLKDVRGFGHWKHSMFAHKNSCEKHKSWGVMKDDFNHVRSYGSVRKEK